jgi:hypothetical protein
MDGPVQWLMALVHYYGLKVEQAAEVLGLDAVKASELHEQAVVEVH